jgi:hypothetical protein
MRPTVIPLLLLAQGLPAQDEGAYYTVDHLVPPDSERLEVGGLDFLSDGRLVCSTRRGQVWIVENPLAADPRDARFTLFAEGLFEGLGLEVEGGEIYVLQRTELSKLLDTDQDCRCDTIETVSSDWGSSGNYHEFAFGLPRAPDEYGGGFFIGLNVSFDDPWWLGKSPVPSRGWILRVARDGTTTPFASGLRSPCGLGVSPDGKLYVTDNQGDWVATSPIYHVKEGAFYGHPASLAWTDAYRQAEREPSLTFPPDEPRTPAALYIPYDWSRSTGNLVWDTTQGAFGPFGGQAFVAELTNGLVLRVQLEEVRGQMQGAVFPFRRGVGSAVRVRFAPDGTLFCGLTERGWGGQAPGDGIARVRWTGELPLEIRTVHLVADGFELEFTRPGQVPAEGVRLVQYDYDYWWEYGSPVRHEVERELTRIDVFEKGLRARLRFEGLAPGMVARLRLTGVQAEDGTPLLHDELAYTINQLPEGPPTKKLVTNKVPPPTPRERWDEGVLWLMQGDPLAAWEQSGWSAAAVELDPADPRRLVQCEPEPGDAWAGPVLTNAGAEQPSELVSRYEYGDVDVHVEFLLPQGGNSGVYLMGRYEVQLLDSSGKADDELTYGDCGGIYAGSGESGWPGRAPTFNAFRRPGRWHALDIGFQAPRFDAEGKKTANARFVRVMMDDTLLHENVEVTGPTGGALPGEVALGPLRFQGDHGHVALRNVRVRLRKPEEPPAEEGWVRIFDGESLDGWKISDGGQWAVADGSIIGSGPRSHLFSPRGDYQDLELRARVKINDGGNSGMYFRTTFGPGWPAGYEAQVNSTHTDPVKTGSLYDLDKVLTRLVPPDTWFTQHVTCREEPEGTRITIRVNGVVVVDHLDRERRHERGHVAFQQHHEGSVVHYRDVEVRERR